MKLGLRVLAKHVFRLRQHLRDTGPQPPGVWVYDLVFFFDAECEVLRGHGLSFSEGAYRINRMGHRPSGTSAFIS